MELLDQIREGYERLTGRACEVMPFAVWRNSGLGIYSVHLLETTWFYEVRVRRLPT